MEIKKSKRANQSNKCSLYFLIGLNISLFLILCILEFSKMTVNNFKPKETFEVLIDSDETLVVDVPIPEQEIIEPAPVPELPTDIEITP